MDVFHDLFENQGRPDSHVVTGMYVLNFDLNSFHIRLKVFNHGGKHISGPERIIE